MPSALSVDFKSLLGSWDSELSRANALTCRLLNSIALKLDGASVMRFVLFSSRWPILCERL